MQIILIISVLCLLILNLAFTMALAGSVTKLIQRLDEEPPMPSVRQDPFASTYDPRVAAGEIPPFQDGFTNRPNNKNWDGISKPKE